MSSYARSETKQSRWKLRKRGWLETRYRIGVRRGRAGVRMQVLLHSSNWRDLYPRTRMGLTWNLQLLPSNPDALPSGSAITQLVLCKTSPQSSFSATGDGLGGTPLGPHLWKMVLNHKQGCRVCDWHDARVSGWDQGGAQSEKYCSMGSE